MKPIVLLLASLFAFSFSGSAQTVNGDTLWYEDFSNGFESGNGSWMFELQHGELWFTTAPGIYNPNQALQNASALYQDHIPLFFENTQLIHSPSRMNGFAMLDADRFNSDATENFPEGNSTTNPIFSILESPPIDLTGNNYAILTFYTFSKICCSNFSGFLTVEFSTNGGATWVDLGFESLLENPIDEPNDQSMSINLSGILGSSQNLSDCRIRYKWNGGNSHFFWMIDDIRIEALPENNLIVGQTFYNNYFDKAEAFENNQISAGDYYKSLEYSVQPDFFANPLNFAAIVYNAGSTPQNNVVLTVSVHTPNGDLPVTFSSEPVNMAPSTTDTLRIETIPFLEISDPVINGEYVFNYIVNQEQEDSNPEDNNGQSRYITINDDSSSPGAIMQNADEDYDGTLNEFSQNVILGTVFTFPEPSFTDVYKVITHIEAVFLYDEDVAETAIGQIVYFNLRSGSVLREKNNNPSTWTSVFFDSQEPLLYSDASLEHVITGDDLWNPAVDDEYVWTSFELPSPILVVPGNIYQAEFRVPVASTGIIFQPTSNSEEPYGSVFCDVSTGIWSSVVDTLQNVGTVFPIRLRTQSAYVGLEKISSENGLELVQNYPNPFHDKTQIQFRVNKTSEIKLEVRDLTGKIVFSKNLGMSYPGIPRTYTFERNGLAAGMYTYTILSDAYQLSRKLSIE